MQDAACTIDCGVTSSHDANVAFMELGKCVQANCPEAMTKPMENLACFIGPCADPINGCCGSLMGCL